VVRKINAMKLSRHDIAHLRV